MQHEGEVQTCSDPWHASARVPVGYQRLDDGTLVKAAVPVPASTLRTLREEMRAASSAFEKTGYLYGQILTAGWADRLDVLLAGETKGAK